MGAIGVLLAIAGPWVLPLFANPADPETPLVVTRGATLLWIAAGYQLFDGLNISSGAALRGAADVRLPALMVLALSWLLFVPLAHSLSFAPGQGWVHWLPQYGRGAVGGWIAALVYIFFLGCHALSTLVFARLAAHRHHEQAMKRAAFIARVAFLMSAGPLGAGAVVAAVAAVPAGGHPSHVWPNICHRVPSALW